MTRLLRSLAVTMLTPFLLALLILAGLVAAAHTDSGRMLLAWVVEEASGGRLHIAGLTGSLPFSPRIARLELRDGQGPWLVLEEAALDLDPRALLGGAIVVDRLAARVVELERLPARGGGGGFNVLPLQLEVRHAAVASLRLGTARQAAPGLALEGQGAAGPNGLELGFQARAQGRGDAYRLAVALDRNLSSGDGGRWRLDLDIAEGPGGLLSSLPLPLLPPPAQGMVAVAGPWKLWAVAEGPSDRLDLRWGLDVGPLDTLAPGWRGRVQGQGTLSGSIEGPELSADLDLDLDPVPGLKQAGPVRLTGRLETGLTAARASLDLAGRWAGQPVALAMSGGAVDGGGWSLLLADLQVAGLAVSGAISATPGSGPASCTRADSGVAAFVRSSRPAGQLRLRAEDLSLVAPLVAALLGGGPDQRAAPVLGGRLAASVSVDAAGGARFLAEGERLGLATAGSSDDGLVIEDLQLEMHLADPLSLAGASATLSVGGLSAGVVTADLLLTAAGPLSDLDLAAEAALNAAGRPLELRLAGRLQPADRRLKLDRFSAHGPGVGLRLGTPAMLDFRDGLAVAPVWLALLTESAAGAGAGDERATGKLELAGRLLPELDLRVRVGDVALDHLGSALGPGLGLAGSLDGEAELVGPVGAPRGRVMVQARELRFTQRAGRELPAARVALSARLESDGAAVDASLEAGPRTRLTVRGRVDGPASGAKGGPGSGQRPLELDLHARGQADLALLDSLLAARGRQASGAVEIDARLSGSLADPRAAGTLRLAGATLRDRTLGVSVSDIAGTLRLDGDHLRSDGLSGRAGGGEVNLAGTVGILADGMPADLRLTARNAALVQLDLLDAEGSLDLRLSGPLVQSVNRASSEGKSGTRANQRAVLSGRVDLNRAELRIPERLPASVAILKVRERGQRRRVIPAPPRTAPLLPMALDLVLAAPRAVFVSGRRLDAELGGQVEIRGTLARPDPVGGFELRRGEFDLSGHRLRFTRGRLGFEGGGVAEGAGLDPGLDFEARASAAGATAILAVRGSARSPRIELSSEPTLPDNEILSRLLFGTAAGRLSGLQSARLGLAATELAGLQGLAGTEGRILETARAGLGLDRLVLDQDEQGGVVLEGSRQLSERFQLGARQGQRAGETQGVMRIEVTPQVKLEADVGAGGGSRAGAAFQVDY
jgi:translocation and assembly module TamB